MTKEKKSAFKGCKGKMFLSPFLCVQTLPSQPSPPEDTIYTVAYQNCLASCQRTFVIYMYMCIYVWIHFSKQKQAKKMKEKTWPKQIQGQKLKMKKQEGKKQHFLNQEGKDGRRWLYKYFLSWQVILSCWIGQTWMYTEWSIQWHSDSCVSSTLLLGTVSGEDSLRTSN